MARESMVLLKNEKHTLPLRQQLKKIVVIGPNADEPEVQLGNYNGFPSRIVTPLEGIRARAGAEVVYVKGSNYTTALPDETANLQRRYRELTWRFMSGEFPRVWKGRKEMPEKKNWTVLKEVTGQVSLCRKFRQQS